MNTLPVQPLKPYLLTNQNSPAFWLIDNLWMPLAGSFLTGNRFALLEQVCATGIGGPPTHTHPTDEGFYVLEGKCTFRAGGETVEAGPGTFISIPRNTEHSFSVDQPQTRVLNFYTPSGFEMILMSIALPAAERKPPPPNAAPLPPRWIVEELSREFGQQATLGLPFVDMPTPENIVTRPSQTSPAKPYGMTAEKSPAYWSQGILWKILASGQQTGGSYSLMEQLCPEKSGPPPHTHRQDEAIYLLEGELTLIAGPERYEVKGGSFAYIPAGTVHSFRVESKTARLLNFYLAAGFERVIMDLGQPAETRTLPTVETPLRGTAEQIRALFESVGMEASALPDTLREQRPSR